MEVVAMTWPVALVERSAFVTFLMVRLLVVRFVVDAVVK